MDTDEGRPREDGPKTSTTTDTRSVQRWRDTYTVARWWVRWTARKRWPDHPTNDDVWAASVASWWCGGGRDD